jgi:protein gp37
LFHEDCIWDFIDKVFSVMYDCHWHTFQVLTKRPERMAEYLSSKCALNRIAHKVWWRMHAESLEKAKLVSPEEILFDLEYNWPLPNVWLGVSCEDKARLPRLDVLRTIPAAVRFVSFEPLLEDLGEIDLSGIHWAISGGESGPRARPHNVQWSRSIGQQCQAAGVAWFHKQHGSRPIQGGDFQAKTGPMEAIVLKDRSGSDPSEWGPGWLQQMPEGTR